MNAREFYTACQRDGRAELGGTKLWLAVVFGRVLLVRDDKYPVVRIVPDDEEIELYWDGTYRPAGGIISDD